MTLSETRRYALSLPEASEETHLHIFVDELAREAALETESAFVEKLVWGGKAVGLRVTLANARPAVVKHLLATAWCRKAPKTLAAAFRAVGAGN